MCKRTLSWVWLVLCVSAVPAAADFQAGQGAYIRHDYATAMKEWRPLAENGHVQAQFNVGLMYDQGRGVAESDQEAVKWYRMAAEQGHAQARFTLGLMYFEGLGVPQSYLEAERWYWLAAVQGSAAAQFNLAVMYAQGQGIPQNNEEALKLYRMAAMQRTCPSPVHLGLQVCKGARCSAGRPGSSEMVPDGRRAGLYQSAILFGWLVRSRPGEFRRTIRKRQSGIEWRLCRVMPEHNSF